MNKKKALIICSCALAVSIVAAGPALAESAVTSHGAARFESFALADDASQAEAMTPEKGMRMKSGGAGFAIGLEKYKDMEPEEAKAAMLADMKAELEKKVADGTITQEKADEIYKKLEASDPMPCPEKQHRARIRPGESAESGLDGPGSAAPAASLSRVPLRGAKT